LGWRVIIVWEFKSKDIKQLGKTTNCTTTYGMTTMGRTATSLNIFEYPAPPAARPPIALPKPFQKVKPAFLEFFAGSGLVSQALTPYFSLSWANDICPKKAAIFRVNHGNEKIHLGSITAVDGGSLPEATLSWASFPCQDLSLAGKSGGIQASRSGLVWEWLRVMDEMTQKPSVLAAENVLGLVSSDGGSQYRQLHEALVERGYQAGAMVIDAVRWLPQSRPRVFVVAVPQELQIPKSLLDYSSNWLHPSSLIKAAKGLEKWLWWKMPEPTPRRLTLSDIIDWEAPCMDTEAAARTISLISEDHLRRFMESDLKATPGYKRTRQSRQVLELRFDDIAGCLPTPQGGSSRQFLLLKRKKHLDIRLLTVLETARLMGAPDTYQLPGGYNEGYKAMGDAVAVPVAEYLAKHLLSKLAAIV
jgi:DNA (cytosine-5)-methyltransferase 1